MEKIKKEYFALYITRKSLRFMKEWQTGRGSGKIACQICTALRKKLA